MGVKRLVVKMHPSDNALVALIDLSKGESVNFEGQTYLLQDDIKAKHKFYTTDLRKGDEVIMYGVLVGKVQCDVIKGNLMTTENLKHAAEPYGFRENSFSWQAPDVSKYKDKTFKG